MKWLGGYDKLGKMLDKFRPDEAVCAIGAEDYGRFVPPDPLLFKQDRSR